MVSLLEREREELRGPLGCHPTLGRRMHSHFLIAFFSPFGFHSIVCVFKFQPGSAILRRISCFWGRCRKGNPRVGVEGEGDREQKALPQDPSARSQLALFSPALSPEGMSCPSVPTAVTFIGGLQGQVPPRKVSGRWAPCLSRIGTWLGDRGLP